MANAKLKATESSINTGSSIGSVFAYLFLVEKGVTETEIKTMAETWINI